MKKRASLTKAKELADHWFSQYTRLKDTDAKGYGDCITSGVSIYWKDGDCGHFMSRIHMSTRWEEQNAHLQSKRDNGPLGGRQYEHGRAIDLRYGEGRAEEIMKQAHTTVKYDVWDLIEIAQKYRKLALQEADKRSIVIDRSHGTRILDADTTT